MTGRLRIAVRVIAVAALAFGVIGARVIHTARSELAAARQAAATGDAEQTLAHYRRAARMYVPASPYHVHALEQLEAIAVEADTTGNRERALAAYRAIRGSIMATRSFYVPERARLENAERHIAALMAEEPAPMDAGKSKEQLRAEHLALLQASPDPNLAWTLVLLVGFAAFVGAAFTFSLRAIDAEDRLVPPEARRWGALIALGFGLFALGLANA